MKFSEALTAAIDEQYTEHVNLMSRIEEEVDGRDLFALSRVNFRIAAEIDAYIDFPDGTEFGTFNNCREYGVTYSRNGWTFAAYEHRNSDEIHIEGCPTDEMPAYGPYGGEGKYDTLTKDRPGAYYDVAMKLKHALWLASPEVTRHELKDALKGVRTYS